MDTPDLHPDATLPSGKMCHFLHLPHSFATMQPEGHLNHATLQAERRRHRCAYALCHVYTTRNTHVYGTFIAVLRSRKSYVLQQQKKERKSKADFEASERAVFAANCEHGLECFLCLSSRKCNVFCQGPDMKILCRRALDHLFFFLSFLFLKVGARRAPATWVTLEVNQLSIK